MFDVNQIRKDFPMLNGKKMQGHPLIYLDNGATTLKPQVVIESVCDYLTNYSGNAHRGDYDLSHEVDEHYEQSREIVRQFINAKRKEEIVFTSGSTDSLNMIAYGYGLTHLKANDEILITVAEHASNTLPWFDVARLTGATVHYINLDETGRLTLENVQKAVTEKTKIIAVAEVTNVLGLCFAIQFLDDAVGGVDGQPLRRPRVGCIRSVEHIAEPPPLVDKLMDHDLTGTASLVSISKIICGEVCFVQQAGAIRGVAAAGYPALDELECLTCSKGQGAVVLGTIVHHCFDRIHCTRGFHNGLMFAAVVERNGHAARLDILADVVAGVEDAAGAAHLIPPGFGAAPLLHWSQTGSQSWTQAA